MSAASTIWTSLADAPRFVVLLVVLLADLMLGPLLASSEFGYHLTQLMGTLVLIAALWAAGAHQGAVLAFIPALAAGVAAAVWGGEALSATAAGLRVLFFGYTTGIVMWRALRHAEATIDAIAGAACAYTLMALVWGNFYAFVEILRPGSFHIPDAWLLGPARDPGAALAYFSFITLTTVGYGDITPAWPGAGGFAAVEGLVGQLYLAITIARLVGLHTGRPR